MKWPITAGLALVLAVMLRVWNQLPLWRITVVAALTAGVGDGPALALLLAGPALSLPSMLVISSIIGPRKTAIYVVLVVIMATFTGWIYGMIV